MQFDSDPLLVYFLLQLVYQFLLAMLFQNGKLLSRVLLFLVDLALSSLALLHHQFHSGLVNLLERCSRLAYHLPIPLVFEFQAAR